MHSVILKSLKEILSFRVILFVAMVTTLAMAVAYVFIYSHKEGLSLFIDDYFSWLSWFMFFEFDSRQIVYALSYLVLTLTITLLTVLFSKKLIITLAKKHYPHYPPLNKSSKVVFLFIVFKATMVLMMLLMFFMPLLFVPILGQILFIYFWSIFLKKLTIYSIGSMFISNATLLKEKSNKATSIAIIASLFNYVPIINTFSTVFAQILFMHHVLGEE